MSLWRHMFGTLAVMGLFASVGCGNLPGTDGSDAGPGVSPYPGLVVTGTVQDVRGTPIQGARVLIWNAFKTGAADSNADGTYSLTVDGATDASWYRVTDARYRGPAEGRVLVDPSHLALGTWSLVSKEEILFSAFVSANPNPMNQDIFMVRADGVGGLVRLTDTPDASEVSPARDPLGLRVRWADVTANKVFESGWNGSGSAAAYVESADYRIEEIGWGDRGPHVWGEQGLLVARSKRTDDSEDITIANDPSGSTFNYPWPGRYPDASPPAFGRIGPRQLEGNMVVFAGTVANYAGTGNAKSGLFTAFPYFTDSYCTRSTSPGPPAPSCSRAGRRTGPTALSTSRTRRATRSRSRT